MKILITLLIILTLFLQYKLWIEPHGIIQTWHLRSAILDQTNENNKLQMRNTVLEAEVKDLKEGHSAIEERARNELNMVKNGENYYQIIRK